MTEPAALAAAKAAPQQRRPDPRYVLRYGSIRDGRIYGRLPVSAASGSYGMRGDASVNITVPAVDRAGLIYRSLPPGKGMWVLEWNDGQFREVVDAGTTWGRPLGTDSFGLSGAGILALLNRRLLIPNVAADKIATTAPLSFTGMDTGSIIRSIAAHVMSLPHGDLPITLQPVRTGTRQQSYNGFDLAYAGPRMVEQSKQDPVTDFRFDAAYTDDTRTHVAFQLVTGTEDAPQLTNARPWRLNATTPGQELVGEVTLEDAADEMCTDNYGAGQGTDVAAVIRSASDPTLTSAGWPRLDGVTQNDSADGAVVQRYADGGLTRGRYPMRGIKVPVKAAWWWGNRGKVGDGIDLTFSNPILGSVRVRSRVDNVAWDVASSWVVLTLADTLAEEAI
jgi:hypothetical protein